jgi:hypothetical protein
MLWDSQIYLDSQGFVERDHCPIDGTSITRHKEIKRTRFVDWKDEQSVNRNGNKKRQRPLHYNRWPEETKAKWKRKRRIMEELIIEHKAILSERWGGGYCGCGCERVTPSPRARWLARHGTKWLKAMMAGRVKP